MIRKLLSILTLLCLTASSAWAQSDITVYATNAAGWDNTYIYYWTDDGDNDWPGTAMELVYTDGSGLKYYKATISDIARGIVFTDGADSNLKQTENITENVADNAFWRVNNSTTNEGKYEFDYLGIGLYFTSGTYTVTTNEEINGTIRVNEDAILTINEGVTMTINGGIVIADGKTLTITGGGKLVVTGSNGGNGGDGSNGGYDSNGGHGATGGDGGDAIKGCVIINGVNVTANGGNGGTGGKGGDDDKIAGNGGTGGIGGCAFSGAVTIINGTVTATGGSGGNGNYGGDSDAGYASNEGGNGGGGGQGGHAFAGTLIIYGGVVSATGGAGGSGGGYGFGGEEYPGSGGNGGFAFAGTMTFYGGVVSATGGAGGAGYDSYFNGTTSKAFANDVVFGTTNYEISGSIAEDNYVTLSADDAIPVTAKLANGAYWSTFYSETMAYKAPEGTQVFAVKLDGTEITLTEVEDRIVDNSQGVVLKQTTDSSEPTTTIVMVASTKPSVFNYAANNSLVGTTTSITNPGNAYVLNYKAATGVGFYKLSATGTIAANRAYLTYSGALAKEYFSFEEDATRVANVNVNDNDNCYYDLQGRCVSNGQWSMVNRQSLKKGIYIVNGKKTVIK